MPIVELQQPAAPNALLTFDGGALTRSLTSGAMSSPRAAIATGTDLASALTDGVAWWLPGVAGSPWLLGYGRFDVTGGAGNDSLGAGILGALDDTIRGGAGDDSITGTAAGQDVLDGGPGQDTLRWSWVGLSNPLTLNMAQAAGTMTLGGTTFTGFEGFNLTLGSGADVVDVRGMPALQIVAISGGSGNDTFLADHATGSIRLLGGPGIDTFVGDFSASNLQFGTKNVITSRDVGHNALTFGAYEIRFKDIDRNNGQTDEYFIERFDVRLSSGNDIVDAFYLTNTPQSTVTISGAAGNDILVGSGGDDVLDGGPGIDTVWVVALAGTPIRLGFDGLQATAAGSDVMRGFENLRLSQGFGWQQSGWAIGDAGPNRLETGIDPARSTPVRLEGMAGNDTLIGGTGHDTLIGGTGSNTVAGGTGFDTLIIDGARRASSLVITPDAAISNGLTGASASVQGSYSGARETTAFTGIENIVFNDGRLVFDPGDPAFAASRLYQVAFNRAPDPFGLNFWIDVLQSGVGIATVARGFTASTEFRNSYGAMDNTGFVTALYQNALGRAPDAPGLSFWTGTLAAGASRESVLIGFSESTEFKGNHLAANITGIWDQDGASASIARLYQATLNRRPEEAGLHGWRAEMAAGKSLADIVPGFTNSAEFTALYGATSNQAFVTLLYNNVLGRAPDAAGLADWVGQLNAGASRTDVVLGFSESLEFRLSTMSWIEGGVVFA